MMKLIWNIVKKLKYFEMLSALRRRPSGSLTEGGGLKEAQAERETSLILEF